MSRERASHLWKNRARSINMRARVFQADGHLKPADLREIVRRDHSRCVYCNTPLDYESGSQNGNGPASFDHIIRLCDGGSNTFENVVCACRYCNQQNAAKSEADPEGAAVERLAWFLARKPGRSA